MYSEVCSLSSSTLQYPNQSTVINLQIKSNHFYCHITTAQCLGEWNSYERAPDSAKKTKQTIYICTDSAKKQQQFTYGQYIFTDCTEDNVQNTHTYTQYT